MLFDKIAVGLLVLSFAALVTTHVALTIGLARRPRRWRAWVAFFAFPLAPWWGWKANMRVRGGLWLAAASCYGLSLLFASAV